jgi:hypothetical protein
MMMLLHCPYPVESRTPRVWSWTSRLGVVLASIAAACLVIRWPQSSLAVPASTGAPHRRFEARRFLTEPIDIDGHLRSRVYVLPVTLPPQFDLDVDVHCSSTSLVQIRIISQFIAIPGTTAEAQLPDFPPAPANRGSGASGWHHVHLHREHHAISIEVDGQTLPESPHIDATPDWLTIEPPSDGPAEFRDLVVTW